MAGYYRHLLPAVTVCPVAIATLFPWILVKFLLLLVKACEISVKIGIDLKRWVAAILRRARISVQFIAVLIWLKCSDKDVTTNAILGWSKCNNWSIGVQICAYRCTNLPLNIQCLYVCILWQYKQTSMLLIVWRITNLILFEYN